MQFKESTVIYLILTGSNFLGYHDKIYSKNSMIDISVILEKSNNKTSLTVLTETRKFSFKTTTFGTIALVQDAHINMPFQSRELRPRGQDMAQLMIIAAIVEAEIQIKVTKKLLLNIIPAC